MSKLLVYERPLMIIPSLALKIGLNEAIVLQQIHYWVKMSKYFYEGRQWVYNTYKEWHAQFPFWSESTIKRTIKSLEDQGYLLSANYNRSKLDQTKWYSIDYEKLAELDETISVNNEPPEPDQDDNGEPVEAVEPAEEADMKGDGQKQSEIPYEEVIDYLNDKTQSSYRATTKRTRELIFARWKEGFTLADFKKVIDLKTTEWLNEANWSRYLRPETLFGAKFESYLNQKQVNNVIREEDFNFDDEA